VFSKAPCAQTTIFDHSPLPCAESCLKLAPPLQSHAYKPFGLPPLHAISGLHCRQEYAINKITESIDWDWRIDNMEGWAWL
jgi:hypothetical protein